MVRRGHVWGKYFDPENDVSAADKLVNEFYDSANTFYLISDYLDKEQPWTQYAEWASDVYRLGYLVPNNYAAAGWRRSSRGLYERYKRRGDVTLEELEMLRDRSAFSKVSEGRGQGGAEHRSRAIALAVESNIIAERAGSDRVIENGKTRLSEFVPWMGSHLYEWRTGSYRGYYERGQPRFAPFMFGFTAHALIEFVEWERENGRDPMAAWPQQFPIDYGSGIDTTAPKIEWETITDAIADVAVWAVESAEHKNGEPMWRLGGFLYEDINRAKAAYDLNLLIAHVYAWLWKETGDMRFLELGNQIFEGGARNGATVTGKHFNQQYTYAFDFLKWREEGIRLHCGTNSGPG